MSSSLAFNPVVTTNASGSFNVSSSGFIAGTAYAGVNATGLFAGTYVAAGSAAGPDLLTLKSTGTAPSGTGANVGHLYADYETDDDELFYLSGTGGTATQLTT